MDSSFLLGERRDYDIKPRKPTDEHLLNMLRQPHVQNYVEACARTLGETFADQLKVIVNIRPGARFKNIETHQEYIYEAALAPYRHSDIARLVLQEAKRPVEDFLDQGYFIFRTARAGGKTDIVLTEDVGERFMMGGREFVSYFSIKVFVLLDAANSDEKTLIEKAWKPK